MSARVSPSRTPEVASRRIVAGFALTLAVAVIGLYLVKWSPYFAKTFVAARHHSLGPSIVTGGSDTAPAAGFAAAWTYATAYYLAIWQAFVLALLLGACIQVLVPARWIARHLGRFGVRPTMVIAGLTAAGMMCTCCTAPVVVGLRKQRAAAGSAMAVFVGNPTLNPAVLLFVGFVLSWPFALLRLVLGLALVVSVAWVAQRLSGERTDGAMEIGPTPIEDPNAGALDVVRAWLRVMWWELYTIVPGYVAIVLLLGAVRVWLFRPGILEGASGAVATVAAATAGMLFVIPTGGEVPIVQTLAHFGLGAGPAAALLITLPAISVPSIFIARTAFRPSVLAAVAATVIVVGVVAGIAASALQLRLP